VLNERVKTLCEQMGMTHAHCESWPCIRCIVGRTVNGEIASHAFVIHMQHVPRFAHTSSFSSSCEWDPSQHRILRGLYWQPHVSLPRLLLDLLHNLGRGHSELPIQLIAIRIPVLLDVFFNDFDLGPIARNATFSDTSVS